VKATAFPAFEESGQHSASITGPTALYSIVRGSNVNRYIPCGRRALQIGPRWSPHLGEKGDGQSGACSG